MLALIAIMTVGIELRDANATPTTIAVSDVNMTDASANAILEYDTVAHIFKQARQLLNIVPDVAQLSDPSAREEVAGHPAAGSLINATCR